MAGRLSWCGETMKTLVLMLLIVVHGGNTLSIVNKFADKSVVEGGHVVLHCQYNSQPSYRMWNYRSASSVEQGFREVAWCPPSPSNCTLKKDFAGHAELSTPNNGSLVISGARRRNDGVYQCKGFKHSDEAQAEARLTVLVPPGAPLLVANKSSPLVDDVLKLECSTVGGNPAPDLRWRWLMASGTLHPDLKPQTTKPSQVFGRSVSRLEVRISATDHLSVVTCEASNIAGNLTSEPLKMDVRRWPGKARISVSAAEPVEKTGLTVNCSSTGGNPRPRLMWQWTRADGSQRELPAPTVLPPDRPFGTTVSQLRLQVDHMDNGAQIACSAVNLVGNSGASFLPLAVIYKPRLQAFPHSPLSVRENQRLSVDCRVNGNPSPEVTWTKDGATVHDVAGSSLLFSRLNRANAGMYKCEAKNTAGSSQMSLELRVLYPPSVNVPNTLVVPEGHLLLLSCRVRAYPRADVHWSAPDGRPVDVAGPDLRIPSVKRSQAGRYECVAQNRLVPTDGPTTSHTARNGTDVIVQYLPSSPTINVSPSSSVLVNSDVRLHCQANEKDPGYPHPVLEWRRLSDDVVLSTNGSFRISRARLQDSGRYRCTPRNEIGAGPVRELELQVEQAPQFAQDLSPGRRTLTLSDQDRDLSVFCTVTGKPLPRITWSRNGSPLAGSGDLAVLFRITAREEAVDGDPNKGFLVKSVLSWRGSRRAGLRQTALRPDDNGEYRCEAANTRGRVSSDLTLIVLYPPIFVNPTVIVAADFKLGTATLSCPVSSQPAPARTDWFLNDDRRVTDASVPARFSVRQETNDPLRRLYTTDLIIKQLRPQDLTRYRCRTSNSLGNNTLTVELRNQSKPETPKQLLVQSSTWESAFLSWSPGFDGGFSQSFTLQVQWANGEDARKAIVGKRYNLTNLLPNTTYVLRLVPVNKLGAGTATPRLVHTTEALFIPRIQDVRLDLAQKRISFVAPPNYCVRVEVSRDRGVTWLPFRDCIEPGVESERVSSTAEEYRASLCLRRRRDVCSEFVRATVTEAGPEVPMVVILAVAIACAVLIVILFAILLFFCLRRRPRRKQFDNANPAHRRPQAVTINPYAPTPPTTGPAVQHHSPPVKPYAMVIPTSGAAMPPAPAYENGAASFGGDDTDCGRSSRGRASPWEGEKRRSSPKVTSTFGVVIGMPGGDGGSVMTPHSNSSQDPLLASSCAPSDPPPYTDTLRRNPPGHDLELQPMGSEERNGGVYATWGRDAPRSLTLSRTSGMASPAPSSTLPLSGGTLPRQPKKVIYEVVV